MIQAFFQGFLVSFGLILAIGAQNAYVLKQGLKKEHIFTLVLICSFIDASLITLGVKGIGQLIAKSDIFLFLVTIFGIIFLVFYGILSLKNAFKSNCLHVKQNETKNSYMKNILNILALSLLNPHVYLDTFLLIGSIGGGFEKSLQNTFIFGAVLASFIWFFSLGYGVRVLIPLFKNPKTWQILDILIAFVMFILAFLLFDRF